MYAVGENGTLLYRHSILINQFRVFQWLIYAMFIELCLLKQ